VLDFVTQDGTLGVLAVSFRQMAEKAFPRRDEPPFVAPAAMAPDLNLLAMHCCIIGEMYARMPVSAAGTAGEAVTELVVVLQPLFADREVRLTASMVDHLGTRIFRRRRFDTFDNALERLRHNRTTRKSTITRFLIIRTSTKWDKMPKH
jgi:hypothetical protein